MVANEMPQAVTTELSHEDAERWNRLSTSTQAAARRRDFTDAHRQLDEAVDADTESSLAAAYPLWLGDSQMRAGLPNDAVNAYERAAQRGDMPGLGGIDFRAQARHHLAAALARSGDATSAIQVLVDLAEDGTHRSGLYEAGELAESIGERDRAAELYDRLAAPERSSDTDDAAQLALRARARLASPPTDFAPSPLALSTAVIAALTEGDVATLERLASPTHFMAGPGGGHFMFEDAVLPLLASALPRSRPRQLGRLLGTGSKRYLMTGGWRGEHFRDVVGFTFTRSSRGWQWTGLVITQATDLWQDRWRPAEKQTNQPLPFGLLAPWPDGQHFRAGGLTGFVAKSVAVVAAGLFGGFVAAGFATSQCGYGTRGFYYNQGPTHDAEDAFAIDFTRYRRFVPFDNESGGTPVLVPRAGLVASACGTRSSGDSGGSNTVEIFHDDPTTGQANRFLSRYMHLAGPGLVNLSPGMNAFLGERIGLMNDTGNSALDHLHFSIHDQSVPFPGLGTPSSTPRASSCAGSVTRGRSVRPTPMEGGTLNDGDDGRCIRSSNEETNVIRLPEGCGRLLVDLIRDAFSRDG